MKVRSVSYKIPANVLEFMESKEGPVRVPWTDQEKQIMDRGLAMRLSARDVCSALTMAGYHRTLVATRSLMSRREKTP